MSKKYNIKDYEFGGWTIPAKRNLTPKQYAELIYDVNVQTAEAYYEKMKYKVLKANGQNALNQFIAQAPNAKALVMKTAKSKVTIVRDSSGKKKAKAGWLSSKAEWKKEIETRLGEETQRFKDNFAKGFKTKFPEEWEQFNTVIDEEFDPSKLRYVGNATYTYYASNGVVVDVSFTNSPQSVMMTVRGNVHGN